MQLCLNQVSKSYEGKKWGLLDVNLEIDSMRIGIVGPFGSGKTTLAQIISTITRPTKGTITFNGTDLTKDTVEFRSVLGYVPQYFGMYSTLTAQEYLEYIAALKGKNRLLDKNRIDSVLETTKLTSLKDTITGSLSGLSRQRFSIAQMLLTDPKILVVDELSDDLNPEERKEILNLLAEQSRGKTLILTSEYASDFDGLVDELYVMLAGRIVHRSSPAEFIRSVNINVWELTVPNSQLHGIQRRFFILKSEHRRDGVHLRCVAETKPQEGAVQAITNLDDAYQYFLSQSKGGIQ